MKTLRRNTLSKTLLESFEKELSDLVDKYSGMEITNSEATYILEMQKNYIIHQDLYDRLHAVESRIDGVVP